MNPIILDNLAKTNYNTIDRWNQKTPAYEIERTVQTTYQSLEQALGITNSSSYDSYKPSEKRQERVKVWLGPEWAKWVDALNKRTQTLQDYRNGRAKIDD